jgi:hypothetical protein
VAEKENDRITLQRGSLQNPRGNFEVYKEVGTGFLEAVYQESLEAELSLRDIPFEAQKDPGSLLLECCSSENRKQ